MIRIRNDRWRAFDFLWMLHTMDYRGRADFNNRALRAFSVLGLVTVLSGFVLFVLTSRPVLARRRARFEAERGHAGSAGAFNAEVAEEDQRILAGSSPRPPRPRRRKLLKGHGSSHRLCRYIMSTSSSYMASRSSPPAAMAPAAQCRRWLRISSRPTARSASCTEEICVMMSAQ